jgi:hypothetical protein
MTTLDQYAAHGDRELNLAVLRTPALAHMGTPTELAGPQGLRTAVDQLSGRIYESA